MCRDLESVGLLTTIQGGGGLHFSDDHLQPISLSQPYALGFTTSPLPASGKAKWPDGVDVGLGRMISGH